MQVDKKDTIAYDPDELTQEQVDVLNTERWANLSLVELQALCHGLADQAGWWDEYVAGDDTLRKHFIAGKIALVHSEVSEALEAFRKDKRDDHLPHRPGLEVEFADAIIRMLDMAGALGLDVPYALAEKLLYNTKREDHTREHRAGMGGKKV